MSVLQPIDVEISPGELIDKITILEIKDARMTEPDKLANVRVELDILRRALAGATGPSTELDALKGDLKAVNEALWRIEDEIRGCERREDFGPTFVELARAVYRQNDKRAVLKRAINELLGSRIVEEKSYAAY